jgi:hypothetical protein
MGRLDVVKSLVRSAALGASTQLNRVRAGGSLRKRLMALAQRRLWLSDSKLTAAVARVPAVHAATVTSGSGRLRVDASFDDGSQLQVQLIPQRIAFAPRGAKEVSVRTEPDSAAYNPKCGDVVAAIATEVAHALWRPFLRGRETGGRRALAHRDGDELVVDLRSVPEVRSALTQPLLAAVIEAFGLRSLEVTGGGLQLVPNLSGLDGVPYG